MQDIKIGPLKMFTTWARRKKIGDLLPKLIFMSGPTLKSTLPNLRFAFQKLHSRIMDLSAADLLLEPERSKAFLLSRNTDSPSNVRRRCMMYVKI